MNSSLIPTRVARLKRNSRPASSSSVIRRARIVALAVAALGAAPFAAADTWDNSSGNNAWSTDSNWADNSEPSSTDPVLFPSTVPGSSSINMSIFEQAQSVTFAASYSLTGGTSRSLNVSSGVFQVNGGSANIHIQLTGTGGLHKQGNGILYMQSGSETSSFTGGVTISDGTLYFQNDGSLGNASNGITINGGELWGASGVTTARPITLGVFGGIINANAGTPVTLNGAFTAASGSNPLTIAGSGTLVTTASSTRTGNTHIQAGTLRLNNGASLGTGTDLIIGSGVLEIAGGITHSNDIVLQQFGTLRAGGTGAVHNSSINVESGGSDVFLSGGTSASHTLQLGGPGSNTYSGGSGTKTVVNGQGRVTILTASNDYVGDWQINSGTLRVAGGGSLGTGTSPVVVNNTGALQLWSVTFNRDINLNNGGTLAFELGGQSYGTHTIANDADVTFALKSGGNEILGDAPNDLTGGGGGSSIFVTNDTAGGTLTLNEPSNYVGSWNIGTSATVEIDGDDSLGNAANSVLMSIGTLRTTQSFSTARSFQTEFGTFDVINGSTFTMLNGIGSGANPSTKTGNGTLVLAANGTRTGGFTISAGTVVAQSSAALGTGAAPVSIATNAALEIVDTTLDKPIAMANFATLRGTGPNARSNGVMSMNGNSFMQIGTGASTTDVFTLGNGTNDITGGVFSSQIEVIGAGKVVLTEPNNYAGGWIVGSGLVPENSGKLEISAEAQLGVGSQNIAVSTGGTLITTASFTLNRQLRAFGGTVETAAGTTLTTALAFGNGNLTKTGAGTLVLESFTDRTSPTSINAGTIRVTADGALGSGTVTVNNGGTLEIFSTTISDGSLVLNNGSTLKGTGAGSSYSNSGDPQITNAVADVFINVPGASDLFSIGSAIRSVNAAASSATIIVNGAGRLVLSSGETTATDTFGGSWSQTNGILQVGQSSGSSINALGFKNGDAKQANSVTVSGGTLAVGVLGSGANMPAWLRANVILNGGNIASTNGIDAQYGGDFTVSAGSTSKVLVFDPSSTATARNVSLVAGAAGTDNLAGSTTWGANSTLVVDPGTTTGGIFTIARTGGTITVGSNATLQIDAGATVNLGGTADALSDGTNHVNVVNNSTTTFNVTQGSKNIGALSGVGNTDISSGASLTIHQNGNTSYGAITGDGALIKEGVGTLSASNVAVGALTVNGGAVNGASIGSVDSGETLTVAGGSLAAPSIVDNGTFSVSSGTVTVDLLGVGNDGTLSTGSETGNAVITGGTVSAKKVLLGSSAGGSGQLTVAGTGTLASEKLAANDLLVNGGTVTITHPPFASDDPTLDGSAVAGYVHDGALIVNSGTLTAPKMKLGVTAGKLGQFIQNGGTVTLTTLGVGNDGTASGGEGTGVAFYVGGTLNVSNILFGSSAGGVGTMTVGAGGDKVLKTGTLTMDDNGGNQLNLNDNKLIVTSGDVGSWDGSAYTGITGLIQRGRGNGTWNGGGIVTAMTDATSGVLTTLAVARADETGHEGGTFGGVSVNGSDVLVMYTWGGDADLNGELNGDDYFFIDSNALASGSVFGFHNGDFDYNGEINGDDYFILDSNILQAQASPPFPTGATAGGLTSVPEPASIGLTAALSLTLLRRRRAK